MLAFRLLEARDGRGVWDSPSLVERAHTAKSQIDFLSDRSIQRGTPQGSKRGGEKERRS